MPTYYTAIIGAKVAQEENIACHRNNKDENAQEIIYFKPTKKYLPCRS